MGAFVRLTGQPKLSRAVGVLALAGAIAGASAAMAGVVNTLPTTSVKGEKCYYYDVQTKESIYSVAQKLGITREAILKYNPSAADGLRAKMRLFFPVANFGGATAAAAKSGSATETYVAKKGDTLYGVAKKFGLTSDELIRLNPSAADGISSGMRLVVKAATQAAAPAAPALPGPDADGVTRYTIRQGDTLYSIATAYSVPLEALLAANPELDPLRYSQGDVITIPAGAAPKAVAAQPAPGATTPTTRAATATAATIASLADAAREQQQMAAEADEEDAEANLPALEPNVEVADNAAPSPVTLDETADLPIPQEYAVTGAEGSDTALPNPFAGVEEAVAPASDTIHVAVMLPFMLSEPTLTRTTQLYTEFYKGMLLGAEQLRNTDGIPVKFHFYDTAANADTLNLILTRPEIKDMRLVVAPDSGDQLAAIVDAVGAEVPVLNIFAVKDESYRNHRNVIQTNIPHDAMYSKAIDMFMSKYADYTPVFLARNGGAADKESFTTELKARLAAEGKLYREITYSNTLTDNDLSALDLAGAPVVFVPISGSKTEFAKFVKAITNLRNNAPMPDSVTLFGYPEWITFRGDSFDEICNLDTSIYSRFMATDSDRETRRVKEAFKQWFGTDMTEAVPNQGVLGYDVATFIVNGLRAKEVNGVFPSELRGVQSLWRLGWSGASATDATGQPTATGGLVNEALYLINYHPGGTVEWNK